MTDTFIKKSDVIVKRSRKRSFPVFVVIRHTRSGDKRIGIYDNRSVAMDAAESIADEAARNYGYGAASVYSAKLILNAKPEMPEESK